MQGDPYVKLMPLTDATAASAEFKKARAASLSAAGMPPQVDPTTVNGVPKAIPGTGGGSNGNGGSGGSSGSANGSVGVRTGGVVGMLAGLAAVVGLVF